MFGGMESASVALVMARRESVPANNAHRPKSPLGKTYSMPPTAGVSKCLSLMYTFTLLALISTYDFIPLICCIIAFDIERTHS